MSVKNTSFGLSLVYTCSIVFQFKYENRAPEKNCFVLQVTVEKRSVLQRIIIFLMLI